jgi:hypothetical protein
MRPYLIVGLVLLILVLPSLSSGACHDLASYKICYNLTLQHDVRCVPLQSSSVIVSDKSGIHKIILSKGKINIIYSGKEKAWILIQEFLNPDLNDQNDQTVIREFLKRENANQGPVFSVWAQNRNGYEGHKAISKKVSEPLTASIVLFWIGDEDKKTRCVIYSELDARYTAELLSSIRIGARS